jgi:hypothetical protein
MESVLIGDCGIGTIKQQEFYHFGIGCQEEERIDWDAGIRV